MNIGEQTLQPSPLLIVLSGPSGAGKDAVLARMKERGYPLHYVVTVTTRPQRPGERDGVDYRFVLKAEFERMIENQEFAEWANVFGYLYGVPRNELRQALSQGQDVIVKVDVQGAATFKNIFPEAVFIFLSPPSLGELEERLRQRRTESAFDLKLRIEAAAEEMESIPMFDYLIVNYQDKIDLTIWQVASIITAEKCRLKSRAVEL